MGSKIFNSLLATVFCFHAVISLKVQINDRQLYRVIPTNNQQLQGLRRLGSNSEVIVWSGMGGIGEPVEYLAVPQAMDKFNEDLLSHLNLTAQVAFRHVEIVLSTNPPAINPKETVPDCPPKPAPPNRNLMDVLLRAQASDSRNSGDHIKKIPGTNLFTGVWYTMRMKRFPQGFVTWTDATNDYGAHFIQIDLNPKNLPHYKPGEKWYNDVQWRFGVTEDPSWYTLDNRVLFTTKNAITTWSYKEVGSGYHIIASTKPEDIGHLSAGGKWRVDALWKPVHSTGNNYALKLKNYPTGTITWTEAKYGDHSHYVQVDTKSDHVDFYAKGGKWFDDSQFSFQPADVQLSASISEFNFMEMPSSVLNSHKKSDSQSAIMKITLLNPSSATYTQEIEESFSKTNTFSYGFEQSLKVFTKVTASFSVPLIASGSVESGFEAIVGSNQQFTRSSTKTYTVRQSVNVPPDASVEVSAFSEWIQDLEIPFNATMIIRGTVGTTSLSGDFLKEYLTSQWEKYNVVQSGREELVVNIRGKFKGTFGYRGIVSVENVNKPRGDDNTDSALDYDNLIMKN